MTDQAFMTDFLFLWGDPNMKGMTRRVVKTRCVAGLVAVAVIIARG
jgi:hypothetical protein